MYRLVLFSCSYFIRINPTSPCGMNELLREGLDPGAIVGPLGGALNEGAAEREASNIASCELATFPKQSCCALFSRPLATYSEDVHFSAAPSNQGRVGSKSPERVRCWDVVHACRTTVHRMAGRGLVSVRSLEWQRPRDMPGSRHVGPSRGDEFAVVTTPLASRPSFCHFVPGHALNM